MPTDCVGDRLKPMASCWLMWRVAHSSAWPHGRILRKSMNITWLMAPRLRPVRSFHLSLCDTWVSLVFFRSSPRQDDSFRGHLYWRGLLSSQPCGIVIMSSFLFSLSLVIRHSLTWATATEGRGGCSSEMHEFRVKLVNKNWNSRVLSLSLSSSCLSLFACLLLALMITIRSLSLSLGEAIWIMHDGRLTQHPSGLRDPNGLWPTVIMRQSLCHCLPRYLLLLLPFLPDTFRYFLFLSSFYLFLMPINFAVVALETWRIQCHIYML